MLNRFSSFTLLQSALLNILDNAIKYSPADSDILVRISDGSQVKLTVTDRGRGFETLDLSRLTNRYERGTNVGDIVGSGLGLTIASDVIRAHGGQLVVENNPEGPGACVSLLLSR